MLEQLWRKFQERLAEVLIAGILSSWVVVGSNWLTLRELHHDVGEHRTKLAELSATVARCSRIEDCNAVDSRVRELERDVARLQGRPNN